MFPFIHRKTLLPYFSPRRKKPNLFSFLINFIHGNEVHAFPVFWAFGLQAGGATEGAFKHAASFSQGASPLGVSGTENGN